MREPIKDASTAGFSYGTNLVAATKWVIAYVPGGFQATKDHLIAAGKARPSGG